MNDRCFLRDGSDPPVCAIHNARLQLHSTSEDLDISKLGEFTFLTCPISGQVIDVPQNHE
jgi:hypothetical protein